MDELVSARVPLQVPVKECYKAFARPVDYRALPGVSVDCFAFVLATTQYFNFSQRFIEKVVEKGSFNYLPKGGAITIGRQDPSAKVNWGSIRIPNLAVVGCDTMGIGHGGGFVTLTASTLHSVISHMIYFNMVFSEGELFGQRALVIDLGGPVYTPTCGLYKAYVLETSLLDYVQKTLERM